MESKRRSSRERLQDAAKDLFAERGYEGTTVAAIVKRAKTSYSQFISHFTDKPGVLSAILWEGWGHINSAIRLAISKTSSPRDRLKLTIDVVISYLERDQTFRTLLLIERATTRDNGKLSQNAGFLDFMHILDGIFEEMVRRGELSPDVHPQVLRSALVGALEGMLRDQLIGEKGESPASYPESAIRLVFSNFLSSALPASRQVETATELPEGALDELPGSASMEGDQHWINRYLDLAAVALSRPGNA